MKKSMIITAAAAIGLAGPAAAQDFLGALGTLDTGVANLHDTTVSLVNGNASATANNLNNTVNGLTTGLSAGTPLSSLAATGADFSNTLVNAGAPVTTMLTQQGAPVADALAPLSSQYVTRSQALSMGIPLADGIIALGSADGGFQGFLVNSDIPGISDLVAMAPPFPGFDGSSTSLPLDALPIPADAFDASTLTSLLGGASLPGLDGAGGVPALPGADALDPAILTDALGGGLPGLPGADGLPALPGADALPADALNPAVLTDVIGGRDLPAVPGIVALPTDALDPSILTGATNGGLPSLPGLDALPTDALDPTIVTDALNGGGLSALPSAAGSVPSLPSVDSLPSAQALDPILSGGLPSLPALPGA